MNSINQNIIIKIVENGIYLNSETFIKISSIDFGDFKKGYNLQKFNCELINWIEIRINSINEEILRAEIVNFKPKGDSYTNNHFKDKISNISFWSKDTGRLFNLTKYSKLINPLPTPQLTNVNHTTEQLTSVNRTTEQLTIKKKLQIPFDKIKIDFACATFEHYIKGYGKNVKFSIKNNYLHSNFDYVKYHFQKLLKKKILTVTIELEIFNDKIIFQIAKSNEIEKIDKNFIDIVKYQRTIELTKQKSEENSDNSILTPDEIFSEFENNDTGNIFNQSDKEILNFILKAKNVRNEKQLEYLSKDLQSENEIIRFSLKSDKSNFGFLFYTEQGEIKHHFIWELLNSNATYIWSIQKNEITLSELFKRINSTINTIKTIGRKKYKKEYKNGQIDKDFDFYPITHSKANTDESFPTWQKRLSEKLV